MEVYKKQENTISDLNTSIDASITNVSNTREKFRTLKASMKKDLADVKKYVDDAVKIISEAVNSPNFWEKIEEQKSNYIKNQYEKLKKEKAYLDILYSQEN